MAWWAVHRGEGPAVEAEFGISRGLVPWWILVGGVTQGVIAGVFNPFVASRLAAMIAGSASMVPTLLFISAAKLDPAGKLTATNLILATVLGSCLIGAAIGAAMYEE